MEPETTTQTTRSREYTTEKITERLDSRRIVLPLNYGEYETVMSTSEHAKTYLTHCVENYPELFPPEIQSGYKLNGWTEASKKMPDKRLRRIRLTTPDDQGREIAYTIAPCDLLPYMTGMVSDVEKALYLKRFGVPDYALTYVFGRNDRYWYTLTQAFGRYNLVGSTVKDGNNIPQDLLADEKHAHAHGETWYVCTTVGQDCVLGASVSTTADTKRLTAAYSIFKQEAQAVNPDYQPTTVNTDGWSATQKAWQTLYSNITTILCFLHAFLKIRSCGQRLGDMYQEIKQQVWAIYRTADRTAFLAGVADLQQWVMIHQADLTPTVIAAINKLCQRSEQFCLTFEYPSAYRTSNMLDRHMQPMARWLDNGRHFHGHLQSAEVRMRAWALLHNYSPYCPRAKISKSFQSPAHKLNGSVYRENWLENLLVSSSCQGFRFSHKKCLN